MASKARLVEWNEWIIEEFIGERENNVFVWATLRARQPVQHAPRRAIEVVSVRWADCKA